VILSEKCYNNICSICNGYALTDIDYGYSMLCAYAHVALVKLMVAVEQSHQKRQKEQLVVLVLVLVLVLVNGLGVFEIVTCVLCHKSHLKWYCKQCLSNF
jgi:hypothetical protein